MLLVAKVKKLYVEIMRKYKGLDEQDKKRVYPEILDLYNERKKAEDLFMPKL